MAEAVRGELTVEHRNAVPDPATLPWVDVVAVLPSPVLARDVIGDGERAVLSLALHEPNVLVVLDERRGRKVAKRLGLKRTGVLRRDGRGHSASARPQAR